jgi:hypothetical protein
MTKDKDKNKLIIEYIETTVNSLSNGPEENTVNNLPKKYEENNMVKKSTLKDLDYKSSNSFISQAAIKELKALLGSPEAFLKLPDPKRVKVQEQLDKLNMDEYV